MLAWVKRYTEKTYMLKDARRRSGRSCDDLEGSWRIPVVRESAVDYSGHLREADFPDCIGTMQISFQIIDTACTCRRL